MPGKVFFAGEVAENIIWAQLDYYLSVYDRRVAQHNVENSEVAPKVQQLRDARNNGTLVARTYLTYGWKYKQRALRNNLEDPVKVILRDLQLPKYVWVTEIGTFDSLSSKDPNERRIFCHGVVDTTAKNTEKESVLAFHAPGYFMHHKHVNKGEMPELQANLAYPLNTDPYFPKQRGQTDFKRQFENYEKNGF